MVTTDIAQVYVKLNGTDLASELMADLIRVEADLSIDLPSMFSLEFHDNLLEHVDDTRFAIGTEVELSFKDLQQQRVTVLKGKISAMEPLFDADGDTRFRVRGYDRSYLLHQERKVRTFNNASDADIVHQIAGERGLSAQVASTSTVHQHVFQDNQTDFEFLRERARRVGRWFFVDDRTLHFKRPDQTAGEGPTLAYGEMLRSFAPRLSTTWQHSEVTVQGWDPAQKEAVIGAANTPTVASPGSVSGRGGAKMQSAFSRMKLMAHEFGPISQAEAEATALSLLDESEAGFVQGEGLALGTPQLRAGYTVTLAKLGTQFSGKYFVTRARHVFSAGEGYLTEFTVSGLATDMVSDLLLSGAGVPTPGRGSGSRWSGVVVGIVTNNDDPGRMARVKVKFPWLDNTQESFWARVATPLAGPRKGFYLMPEVNDEVLVAFEQGDFNRPYVVGSLWNGKDELPSIAAGAADGDRAKIHELRTKGASYILLNDVSGNEKIELRTEDGHTVLIDKANKKIEVKTAGGSTVLMDDQGKKVEVSEPSGLKLTLDGNARKLTASSPGDIELNATGGMTLKANGTLQVQASGPVSIKGAVVNIN